MPQIKDIAITKTVANDSDFLIMQNPITGETYKITKANLLAGSSSTPANTSLWLPSQLNLALWLDADDSSTFKKDSNNLVETWYDKGQSKTRHLHQISDSLKPSVVNQLNGRNTVTFDGTNDFFRAADNYDYGSDINMFFVAKYINSNRNGLFDSAPNQPSVLRNFSLNAFEWWAEDPSLAINCAVDDFEILNFYYQLAPNRSISKYINGSNFTKAFSNSTEAAAWGQLTIGAINTNHALFNGSVAEIIFITSTLTELDRQKIEGYLAWKWGLNFKLADSHPYKNNAPAI